MTSHSGNSMLWIVLAFNIPLLAIGDAASNIYCSQSCLCLTTGLVLKVTCQIKTDVRYDRCLWEKTNEEGNTDVRVNNKNECSMSVRLTRHSIDSTNPVTPPVTYDVYFESNHHSAITKNRQVIFSLPHVHEGQCRLRLPRSETAPQNLACKLLTFTENFLQTTGHLEQHMCTSHVLDSEKTFMGISDLGRKLKCFQGDTEIESSFEVDMQYVRSLARVTISGLENIRVKQSQIRGSRYFRFTLSFRHPRGGVAIRFLLQRPYDGPLLVECAQDIKDCQTPAAIYGQRTRRTTHSTWMTHRASTYTTTSSETHVQMLSDDNSNTKTKAVTIVAAILGGILIVVLVTIVIVVVLVRRKKLKKRRLARPSMCRFMSHEEEDPDMIENVLYAERHQWDGSCEMIQNDLYRSQENVCDDNPIPGMTGDYFLPVPEKPKTATDVCVTGNFRADDGILPSDDTPSEAMIYSTIDSASTDKT